MGWMLCHPTTNVKALMETQSLSPAHGLYAGAATPVLVRSAAMHHLLAIAAVSPNG